MTNAIVDGVCRSIATEFGEQYRIYTEQVEQGFTEPCFFVNALNVQYVPLVGSRYNRKQSINVTFYPTQGDGVRAEVYEVAERLVDTLEYILMDNELIKSEPISAEFVGESPDIIVSTKVEYNFTVNKVKTDESNLMESLKQSIGGKENG